MYLCYINKLGPNYKGELIYEFIFTNDIDNVIITFGNFIYFMYI